jgi:outer membrane lipoprotein SlyB
MNNDSHSLEEEALQSISGGSSTSLAEVPVSFASAGSGAAAGGVGGAIVGSVVGDRVAKKKKGRGMGIGAAVGAVGGAGVGALGVKVLKKLRKV